MNDDLFDTTIYLKSSDNKYRYALGTKGEKTLFCFGINPSTATPEKYDPTINRVKNTAVKNDFDSFVMLNIYPLRATNPDDLPRELNWTYHNKNIEIILKLIKDGSTIWAAWGDFIDKREQFINIRNTIFGVLSMYKKNIRWVKMGDLTKNGNPRHPLYTKYQEFSEYKTGELK